MGLYLIDNYQTQNYTLADFVERNYSLGKVLSHISDSLKSAMAIPGKSIVKVIVENSGIISITEIFCNELNFSINISCNISDRDFIIDGIKVFFDNAKYNLKVTQDSLDDFFVFEFAI
jgi:hypothetical protein